MLIWNSSNWSSKCWKESARLPIQHTVCKFSSRVPLNEKREKKNKKHRSLNSTPIKCLNWTISQMAVVHKWFMSRHLLHCSSATAAAPTMPCPATPEPLYFKAIVTIVASPARRRGLLHENKSIKDHLLRMMPCSQISLPSGTIHKWRWKGSRCLFINHLDTIDICDIVQFRLILQWIHV